MKKQKLKFEDIVDMFRTFKENEQNIHRQFWNAKQSWKDVRNAIKTAQEPGKPSYEEWNKIQPDIKWFLEYRQRAKNCIKENNKIKSKINAMLRKCNAKK